jgi:tetratricopeptide (TPR) repeat protein
MSTRSLKLVVSFFLVVVTLTVYGQVRNHDFVNFDDDIYVTENPRVQAGLTVDSVVWAFTTTDAEFWHPLTWMSHMLDCQVYGLNPTGHHFTNLLLHLINTLLLFIVLQRMTGAIWQSAFVSALFALHPLHVESVAWVAERKDVLSTLLWILTLGAYIRYTEHPALNRYVLTLMAFIFGLMAKPMLVTLPFVLLLLDFWPLNRFRTEQKSAAIHLLLEKLPFVGLSVLFSVLTFLAQQKGGLLQPVDMLPLWNRVANALVSYIGYAIKMVWPCRLAVYYHQTQTAATWKVLASALALVFVSIVAILRRRRHPYLIVGWFWYIGTLVPVIGLVQIATFTMADRYTYVPLIGLFIAVAWGVPDLLGRWQYRKNALALLGGVALAVLTACSWLQLGHWENSVALWKHTAEVTENNYSAYTSLGAALVHQGRLEDAIRHISEALRIKPDYAEAHNNLGLALYKQGNINDGISHFLKAVQIDPDYAKAYNNLGSALAQQGKLEDAIRQFSRAIEIDPDLPEVLVGMGLALDRRGRLAEAIIHYSKAVAIRPYDVEIRNNLGVALARKGDLEDAIGHFSKALQIDPNNIQVQNNLMKALQLCGRGSSLP